MQEYPLAGWRRRSPQVALRRQRHAMGAADQVLGVKYRLVPGHLLKQVIVDVRISCQRRMFFTSVPKPGRGHHSA